MLPWFSGSIGFHPIHHLSPRIPNDHLEACYRENELIRRHSRVISLSESFQTVRLALIDESNRGRLLRFHDLL